MGRRTTPRFWLFMIVTTAVVFAVSFGVLQVRYARDSRILADLRSQRNELAVYVEDLTDQLAYAQTDEYVMRAARDELGMLMPTEVRYVNGTR